MGAPPIYPPVNRGIFLCIHHNNHHVAIDGRCDQLQYDIRTFQVNDIHGKAEKKAARTKESDQ